MSKKSRSKYQANKKKTKSIAAMSRREAQLRMEVAELRTQLDKEVSFIDKCEQNVKRLVTGVILFEKQLKRIQAHILTGASVDTTKYTRDEQIAALDVELKKLELFKQNTVMPVLREFAELKNKTDESERILGEAEMVTSLQVLSDELRAYTAAYDERTADFNFQDAFKTYPLDTTTAIDTEKKVTVYANSPNSNIVYDGDTNGVGTEPVASGEDSVSHTDTHDEAEERV